MVLPLLLYTIEHCDGISCANKLQSVACLLKATLTWLHGYNILVTMSRSFSWATRNYTVTIEERW